MVLSFPTRLKCNDDKSPASQNVVQMLRGTTVCSRYFAGCRALQAFQYYNAVRHQIRELHCLFFEIVSETFLPERVELNDVNKST